MIVNQKKFAIIDIETTGGYARRDKITEIAILQYFDGQLAGEYTTLINPERSIPPEITRITGITDKMVESAPKFYEVAREIILRTEDCVFVAHNVHFDYEFIRAEFQQLGYSFTRQKMCTLQLSRRYFRGLSSYSLGNLIAHFSISVSARHRALEDCRATLFLLERIIEVQRDSGLDAGILVKSGILASKLPAALSADVIGKLPNEPGIYTMLDKASYPVYIGKSKRIRERVMQHFNGEGPKLSKMLQTVCKIEYQITGNELVASLLESQLIRQHKPEINKALRKKTHSFLLTCSKSAQEYMQFSVKEAFWLEQDDIILSHYPTRLAAKKVIDGIIARHELCTNVNSGIDGGSPCSMYHINLCGGACVRKESPQEYNVRFDEARCEIQAVFSEDFIVVTKASAAQQQYAIVVENGFVRRLGLISQSDQKPDLKQIEHLAAFEGNAETNRMLKNYLSKEPEDCLVYPIKINLPDSQESNATRAIRR
ncbi:MAG: DNA polymerase III PolC-type [Saprospiraceae bacterium]|jgi:DNA polymerase-3 subunit epsilon|nr:DNA polymerase III PolC-type [Saprospiraceae bacterium]